MEIGIRPAGRTVHRDEIAERHAKETNAGQARGSHREIVVLGIELDDHRLLQLERIPLRVFLDRSVHEVEHIRVEHGGLVLVQSHQCPGVLGWLVRARRGLRGGARIGQVLLDDEVLEAVDQPQRVHDRRTERIAAVRHGQMLARLVDAVLAQQVHAKLGVRRVESGLDVDGFLVELDRLAIAARDHIEIGRDRVRVAVARVGLERARGPLAVGLAAQEIGRGLERVDFELRQLLLLRDRARFVELRVGLRERAVLEVGAREQQIGFDARVRRLLDHLVREISALFLEPTGRDARQAEHRGRVVLVEHQALFEQLRRLVVLMRREEQVTPTRAHRRVHRVFLDRLLEKAVRSAHVAARSRGVRLDP